MAQEVPRWSRSQDGLYGPQHASKRDQDGPKGTQGGPNMALRWPQEASKRAKLGPKMEYSTF